MLFLTMSDFDLTGPNCSYASAGAIQPPAVDEAGAQQQQEGESLGAQVAQLQALTDAVPESCTIVKPASEQVRYRQSWHAVWHGGL